MGLVRRQGYHQPPKTSSFCRKPLVTRVHHLTQIAELPTIWAMSQHKWRWSRTNLQQQGAQWLQVWITRLLMRTPGSAWIQKKLQTCLCGSSGTPCLHPILTIFRPGAWSGSKIQTCRSHVHAFFLNVKNAEDMGSGSWGMWTSCCVSNLFKMAKYCIRLATVRQLTSDLLGGQQYQLPNNWFGVQTD